MEGFTSGDITRASQHLHPLWTVTTDGSLRNGGVEFITTGGKGGEVLHQCFERMTTLLRDVVNYDASWRCSTHMHINMLDFTCNQVARFMLVYTACEPILFQLAGKQRRSSNFCTPIGDSLTFHRKLISRMYDDTVANRGASAQTNKYTALNFQPLFGNQNVRPLGTIEFRGGRPMVTMEELLLQTNILLSIKDFVRNFSGTEDEMLVKLADGVFNTVFANGCAASLDSIRVDELEYALIQAWMLLKSYQEGMKNRAAEPIRPPSGSSGFATAYADWANTPIPQPVRAEADNRRRFWTASTPGRGDRIVGNDYVIASFGAAYQHEAWPRFGQYLARLQRPSVSVHEKAAIMVSVLTDPSWGHRLTQSVALVVATNWVLSRGAEAREEHPIGTLVRTLNNRLLPMSTRQSECLDTSVGHQGQPVIMCTSANVDYLGQMRSENLDQIARLLHYPRELLTNRFIWQALMNTTVRLVNKDILTRAYETRCALPEGSWTHCPDNVSALQAYYLFRLCNVPSANHVRPSDAPVYDEMVRVMELIIMAHLHYPVIHRSVQDGVATRYLYVIGTRQHTLRYMANVSLMATHQSTPTRVSAATGQRIY